MKKDWKYILYVSAALGIFVLFKLMTPKQFDWSETYAHDDKDPYGTFALFELLPSVSDGAGVNHSYQTLYELGDSMKSGSNIFILSRYFSPQKEDVNTLLKHVNNGGTAFIGARHISGILADTLKLQTYDNLFGGSEFFDKKDSAYVSFLNPALDTTHKFWYRRDDVYNYFKKFDTTRTTVVAQNSEKLPVTIRVTWGEGNLILTSAPVTFTNIYLLSGKNSDYVSGCLSYLQTSPIFWTEFYHLGRMEARTPLRYILKTEPLAWAYYLTIASLVIFMIFEAKRRQRVIPVIKPLGNTTLEFVSTIGNLYFQSANHKNIAEKKIQFLLEQIRTRYRLDTTRLDDDFLKALALKAGKPSHEINMLFSDITSILSLPDISSAQLKDLNLKIEKFNHP
ncbi:MAG TPA: DUF4350 domain-containing protein [Chryseosolibacter sp.]|nr:DUF4350 domain-containing protein [Chryseosolibacter sp.]